jgi:AcrR family transcriptional regulator
MFKSPDDEAALANPSGADAVRRLSPEERLPLILDAALAEFADRGYGGARMAAVAARAGITKSLIYHYFPSKAELFKATIRSYTQQIFAKAERELDDTLTSAWDLARSMVEAGYKQSGKDGRERQLLKLIFTEAERFPELARFYREEILIPGTAIMRRLLQVGAATGEFRPELAEMPFLAEILMAPPMMASMWRLILDKESAPDSNGMITAHLALMRLALTNEKK